MGWRATLTILGYIQIDSGSSMLPAKPSIARMEHLFQEQMKTKPLGVEELKHGSDHWVFKVTTPNNVYVMRFPIQPVYIKRLHAVAELNREWHKRGVPVPLTVAIGNGFSIEQFREGVPLNHSSISETQRRALMVEWGKLLRRMHGLKAHGYGRPRGKTLKGRHVTWDAFLQNGWNSILQNLSQKNILGKREVEALKIMFREFPQHKGKGSVLHGDLYPSHVLVHGGRINGIIDAADLLIGDRLFDLGILRTAVRDKKHFEQIMQGYGNADRRKIDKYAIYFLLGKVSKGRTRRRERKQLLREMVRKINGRRRR